MPTQKPYARLRDLTAHREAELNQTFEQMARFLQHSSEKASVQFRLMDHDQWLTRGLILKGKSCKTSDKAISKPDLEIVTKASVWLEIAAGRLSPMEAFVQGKLRIRGDAELGKRLVQQLAASDDGIVDVC